MVEITLEGPGKNSLGTEMMRFLRDRLRAAQGAPVLLCGAGDAFSAGLNLKELAGLDEAGMAAFLDALEGVICDLYLYPGPTVAWVNGHAIAGGCVLALCCDRAVAHANPKLKIGLNEVALGLRFPPRTWEIVRRRIPPRHHEQVLLGAGLHNPEAALRLGLVDEVSPDAGEAARATLGELAALPPAAYAAAKRDLRGAKASDLVTDRACQERLRELMPAWTSPELKARLMAALKR